MSATDKQNKIRVEMGSVGRPLKFETPEILQAQIDKYFTDTKKDEWTITGLALALNTSRETLINYQEREEFFDAIKKAKDMVEHSYELDLKKKGHSGSIFALKNFDWSDKQQVDQKTEHSGTVGFTGINIIKPNEPSND